MTGKFENYMTILSYLTVLTPNKWIYEKQNVFVTGIIGNIKNRFNIGNIYLVILSLTMRVIKLIEYYR